MLKFKKKVMKSLVGKECHIGLTKNVAGGHDFPPSAFRGCQSNDSFAQDLQN
ncbi:hypothetical protein [Pseudoalteromonas rubra]|uniref:hypothetical protein n=1 Tax=Pseudoalteromonas rubra TaxID=43658 RepID=UPI000AA8F32E|nr:hypothetical protein [Pseudoalteromonas rubra]